ncbi:50S ribosomal protein L1 [Candidatus Uhrbacteria bacterium]|nr:50S ribosomal protein L1 [Candidatus Uhrbacteria bacterium]
MKRGKRYGELAASFDAKKTYGPDEAIELAQRTSNTKFDSSIEVHVLLGIDPKKSDQLVRSTVALPHGTGKTKRIAVFTSQPDKEKEAKESGADLIGGEDLIAEIAQKGKIEFDVAVATPELMPKMAKIAKILGPRGLMPSPKNETVTPNVKKTVEELRKGKVAFKNDDTANIHQVIGRASFKKEQLIENYAALMDALRKAKPSASKGTYIKQVSIASTMGPGIRVSL